MLRQPQATSSTQLISRRTAPKFTPTKYESGGSADCIESHDNNNSDDDSNSTVKNVEARRHGNASMLPEPLEEDYDNQDDGKSDTDDNDNDVQPFKAGKRRHPPSVDERNRFVMPRLSGPSLVSQSLNTMSLSGAAQMHVPTARPSFKFPAEPSSPPHVPLVFSPRRRGEKFVSGGFASTVRAWVMEAAQTSYMNKSISVEHYCTDEGFVFVEGQGIKAVIAGLGKPISRGSILTIKRGWAVQIQATSSWIVAVEWTIG